MKTLEHGIDLCVNKVSNEYGRDLGAKRPAVFVLHRETPRDRLNADFALDLVPFFPLFSTTWGGSHRGANGIWPVTTPNAKKRNRRNLGYRPPKFGKKLHRPRP